MLSGHRGPFVLVAVTVTDNRFDFGPDKGEGAGNRTPNGRGWGSSTFPESWLHLPGNRGGCERGASGPPWPG